MANLALRRVLGESVQQKGSLVDSEKLRFDFSHGKSLSDAELSGVQTQVDEAIGKKDLPVYIEEAPQEQALKINGLRAVFGEKYPPMVRVVSIGVPVHDLLADPGNPKWREFSIEFCGGTHLAASNEAGRFAIVAEESVSKGIRRIVALTDKPAAAAWEEAAMLDGIAKNAIQLPDGELGPVIADLNLRLSSHVLPLGPKRRIQTALAELQARSRAWEKAHKSQGSASAVDAVGIAGQLLEAAEPLGSAKLIVGEIAGASDDQLRSAVDSLRKKAPSHAILLAAGSDGKVTFVAAVSDDVVGKGLKAGDWVKTAAAVTGGGGGGRPQMAQGSGKDPSKIAEALEAGRGFAKNLTR
jgi:alanyl-tRNA synthetase